MAIVAHESFGHSFAPRAGVTASSVFINSKLETVKRYVQVVPAGLAITLFLLFAMERLIATEEIEAPVVEWREIPNPVMDIKPPTPTVRDRPEKPKPVEDIPELPDLDMTFEPNPRPTAPDIGQMTQARIEPNIGGYSSNTPIPTVLVQPDYPARAITRGIEGWVDVRFDVTPLGTTTNIQITQAQPEKIFNRAAQKAVKSWKFQPVTVKGQGVLYEGIEQRITFQMEK